MSVRTDYINLNVNVNGDAAKNELNQLRKKSADLNAELKSLHGNSKRAKEIKQEIAQIDTKMGALKKSIGLTSLSQKELITELKRLQQLKNVATPQTKEFKELQLQIDAVTARLKDVRNGTFGFKSMWGDISKGAKEFALLSASYLGFEFLTSQVQNIISGAGKVSDKLADLQRVAGFTSGEVNNLYKSLRQIDTRTSNSGLLDLAIIASKLGIAKDELVGFTRALDELNVALGDELGDADKVAEEIGKIINVYDKGAKITGERARQIGNAIVTLANEGVASGGYNVDFVKRLAGIANAADIALGPVMGLGAGFEELGQTSEVASTAVTQIIGKIGADLPKYAKLAGKDIKDFAITLRDNPIEALLQLAEGLTKNKKGFAEIAVAFADAEANGVRVTGTLATLGAKADFFRDKINTANEALNSTNAITDAYRLKNENLGAVLDKIGKKLASYVNSEAIIERLSGMFTWFGKLIGAIDDTNKKFGEFREQRKAVQNMEASLLPLINQYEELSKKTSLNKEEQDQLKLSFDRIASAIPYAVTQFDEYGRALAINTERAKEFIKYQKLALQEKNRELITGLNEDINKQIANVNNLKSGLQRVTTTYDELIAKEQKRIANLPKTAVVSLKESEQELQRLIKERDASVKKYQTAIPEAVTVLQQKTAYMAELAGKSVDDIIAANAKLSTAIYGKPTMVIPVPQGGTPKPSPPKKSSSVFIPESKEEEKERKKREKAEKKEEDAKLRKMKSLQEKLQNVRDEISVAAADDDQKELQRAVAKYKELFREAIGHSQELAELKELEQAELSAIFEKWAKKNREKYQAESKKEKEDAAEKAKKKKEWAMAEHVAIAEQALYNTEVGSFAELQAHEALLKAKFDAETAFLDKSSEQYKAKQAELNASLKDANRQYAAAVIAQIEQMANAMSGLMQSYYDVLNQRDRQALQRAEENNESRKQSYRQMLDSNMINQEEYNSYVAALDADLEKKKKESAKREAKRAKALGTFQTIINTAAAVANALNTQPAWLGIVLAAIVGATGAAQLVKINEADETAIGRKGLVVQGPSHENQGIDMVEKKSGKTIANVEGGEPVLVMSKALYGNNRELIDKLMYNSMYNNGARVQASWMNKQPAEINTPRIIPLFRNNQSANSGSSSSTANASSSNSSTENLLNDMIAEQQATRAAIQQWPTTLQAFVSLQDLRRNEELLQLAKNNAGLNQDKNAA